MRGNFLFKERREEAPEVQPVVQLDRLSDIFMELGIELQAMALDKREQMEALQEIYQRVYGQVCIFCKKQVLCWQEEVDMTCEEFARACNLLDAQGLQDLSAFSSRFQGRCSKTGRLEIALYNQMEQYQYRWSLAQQQLKMKESIADQLIDIGMQLKQHEFQPESAHPYQLLVGVSASEKAGNTLSGDSWGIQELSGGRIVQILSDGMGTGAEANMQSATTVHLLKVLLAGGLDLPLSLRIVNTVLSLRFSGERFSTVDLAIWDYVEGKIEFYKLGATPSYVKRGKQVSAYEGASLPLGILPEVEGSRQEHRLQEDDLLVMMSDGLYDLEEKGIFQWEEVIRCIPTNDPQLAAEYLLAIAGSRSGRKQKDDLTVVVSRLVLKEKDEIKNY